MSDLSRTSLDRRALGLALTRIANVTTSEAFATVGDVPAKQARRTGITGKIQKSALKPALALGCIGAEANA